MLLLVYIIVLFKIFYWHSFFTQEISIVLTVRVSTVIEKFLMGS